MDPVVLDAEIEGAWATLLGQSDAIADDITLTLIARDPYWTDQGPAQQADLRANCREHIRRGILAMAGRRDPEHKATDLWRDTGRLRARQGVPMDRILNAYTLGTRTLWEALLHRSFEKDGQAVEHLLVRSGQKLWAALEIQNAIMVEAYRRESVRLQRQNLQRQQSFLDGLVEGRGADPEFAREARDALGLGANDGLLCVVAPFTDPLDEPLRAPEDRLERAGVGSHWHVRGGYYFGLIAHDARPVADIAGLLEPCVSGRVGIAPCQDGLAGFAAAYQLAARAAESLPRGTHRLIAAADRLPEVLIAGSPEIVPVLVAETVGPLLHQPPQLAETLLDTLAALLANDGSPTHAAVTLYCHRNTVIYRMRQIETITGRSLHNARDKFELTLGLLATGRTLAPPRPPTPEAP